MPYSTNLINPKRFFISKNGNSILSLAQSKNLVAFSIKKSYDFTFTNFPEFDPFLYLHCSEFDQLLTPPHWSESPSELVVPVAFAVYYQQRTRMMLWNITQIHLSSAQNLPIASCFVHSKCYIHTRALYDLPLLTLWLPFLQCLCFFILFQSLCLLFLWASHACSWFWISAKNTCS